MPSSNKPRKACCTWTHKAEEVLLDSLKKVVVAGITGDNNFQPAVYNDVASALQKKQFNVDSDQVKSC